MGTTPREWAFNRTIFRVIDAQKSIDFYKFLGLDVLDSFSNPKAGYESFILGALLLDYTSPLTYLPTMPRKPQRPDTMNSPQS
jgi:catechol 2,3-dioxygenase-like lactoylglutathione lyase family enzyme